MSEKKLSSRKSFASSIDVKIETKAVPRKLPQYIAGLSATIGALAAGTVIGWSSPAGDDGSNLVYPFEIDAAEFSWISSTFTLGAAAISMPVGALSDLVGRRRSMLLLTVPFTIGWACVIWPNSSTTLILGRFLLGIGGGAFCVTVPIYTAEIADPETRGRLGSYMELLQCTGILVVYALGLLDDMFVLSVICATFPLIFFGIFFFMPESPTYHLTRGDVDAARDTLTWLRGSAYDVEAELEMRRNSLAEAKRYEVSFLAAIRSRAALKGLFIAYGLMFFQQFSGINAIIFYGGGILDDAIGATSDWPTIIVAVAQVVTVFLSTLLVDKWGRRPILLFSATVMCSATLVIGIYFFLLRYDESSVLGLEWLPLVCVCGFVVSMEFGFGPIPWMMTGEIFSSRVRGLAGSSACSLNWTMAFVVTKFYGDLRESVGTHGTFWIFSGISGLGIAFVGLFVPETKGKSLEQIQIELGSDQRIYDRKVKNKQQLENLERF